MAEYTYKDVIIDPTSEEARTAIGKKCYMQDSPTSLVMLANNNELDDLLTLGSINAKLEFPFVDKEYDFGWSCIIVKKEEPKPKHKSKYIPYQITTRNLAEYWEKLKGRAFIIDDEECTLIETVTRIYKDFDAKEADINKYSVSMLCDEARWLDTGEPVGEEIEDE